VFDFYFLGWRFSRHCWRRFDEAFLQAGSRYFWLNFITALVIALAAFVWFESRKKTPRFRQVLRYLFPRSVWLSRSALVDYLYVFINGTLLAVLVAPWVISADAIGLRVGSLLRQWFDVPTAPVFSPLPANIGFSLALLFTADLAAFIVHVAFHRVPILWQFHKVHHSATVLTPLTAFRLHPLEQYITLTAFALAFGVVTGVFRTFQPMGLAEITVLGANVGLFVFDVFGSNLSHSQVWVSWGPLNRVFLSPALHQIHHSDNPKHFDKNFGIVLSIWDALLGTLYLPREKEKLTYGLGNEENEAFRSVWRLYLYPFFSVYRMMATKRNVDEAVTGVEPAHAADAVSYPRGSTISANPGSSGVV